MLQMHLYLPLLSSMDLAVHGQDPPIQVLHICAHCHSHMGVLRVHEGSNKPHCRGKIIQSCVSCLKSHYHTEAYIFSDAQHLLVRYHCRQAGNLIPEESANAPLWFRPAEHEPPAGPVLCHAGCTTKGGDRKQGSRQCIALECKTCCVRSGQLSAEQQTYREHCKVHKVPAVVGRPIADARAPAPHAAAAAAPVQPPQPAPAPAPILPPIHPAQPPHAPGVGRGRGNPVGNSVARPHGTPAARPRTLAQPMSNSWVNQRQVVLNEKGPDPRAEKQRLEKLEQQSCDFVFYHTHDKPPTKLGHAVTHYPKMQLSSTPLLQGLGMTENSWIDIYNYAESSWKTLQATAVFLVDKSRPTILRIRPSLLVELNLGECPGIEELLIQQPRTVKRKLDDLVSPPKKRTQTDDAIRANPVIVIDDSLLPSPTLPPSTTSGTFASTYTSTVSETQAKIWPGGYYIYEHEAAWVKYNQAKDEYGRNKVSIPALWNELFPGSKFKHTTVTLWRKFWNTAPLDVKDRCVKAGRRHGGSWQYFVDAVRAHSGGHPLVEPDVKMEASPSTSTVLRTIPEPSDQQSIPIPPPLLLPAPIVVESCDFCDAEITIRPSPKLDQIMADILPLTQSSPTPQNLSHRTAHSPRIYASYCKQHEVDSRLLPAARAAGWPEKINYSCLRGRVEVEVLPTLHDLLEEIKESNFFVDALAGKFKKATGHFGEIGYYAIFHAVGDKFTAGTILSDCSPMSRDALLEQVLVPEAIFILISADLDVEHDEAVQILLASTEFGLHYHSDPLDRQRAIMTSLPSNHPQLPASESTQRAASSSSLLSLPSPLGSPILSPALEPPTNWDFVLDLAEPEPQPFDPALLCNYCDELLPAVQSETLLAMGEKLFALSWDDPLPENSHHRRMPRITMTVDYCKRHRFERDHLPKAMAAGWPLHPNFGERLSPRCPTTLQRQDN
ncbi:hypothetical protein B0H14DRAFT_3899159 [Mycena olivaceomarginata]|nr:hypothetical protein B0H14DRAFT_3899159 [Mycena olivaceomarginata]